MLSYVPINIVPARVLIAPNHGCIAGSRRARWAPSSLVSASGTHACASCSSTCSAASRPHTCVSPIQPLRPQEPTDRCLGQHGDQNWDCVKCVSRVTVWGMCTAPSMRCATQVLRALQIPRSIPGKHPEPRVDDRFLHPECHPRRTNAG